MTAARKAPIVSFTGRRHDLPSGAWVEIRDPMQITHGQWTDTVTALSAGATLDDLAMAVSIVAWSYDLPVPSASAADSIRDIPQADAVRLGNLLVPALRLLHPNFAVSEDKESPTGPSTG